MPGLSYEAISRSRQPVYDIHHHHHLQVTAVGDGRATRYHTIVMLEVDAQCDKLTKVIDRTSDVYLTDDDCYLLVYHSQRPSSMN